MAKRGANAWLAANPHAAAKRIIRSTFEWERRFNA
jgi:hypothetical protein